MSYLKLQIYVFLFLGLFSLVFSQSYTESDLQVNVLVNKIGPFDNPSETYKYYDFPYCRPKSIFNEKQSLGEDLSGDRKMNSLYQMTFGKNVTQKNVCNKTLHKKEIALFKLAIQYNYISEFFIDDQTMEDNIGKYFDQMYYLKNHLNFMIYYKDNRIVYANISDNQEDYFYLNQSENKIIMPFSYSVTFVPINSNNIKWVNQEIEEKIEEGNPEIHWFAIINSFFLVVLLTTFIVVVISKYVKKDLLIINDYERSLPHDVQWKLIRNEVMNYPPYQNILAAFIGIGFQFLAVGMILLIFGIIGIHFEYKHSVKTITLYIYCCSGAINGYFSAKYYKAFRGKHWALNILTCLLLFPLILFIIWSVLNTIAWASHSTSAIPFTAVLFVVFMLIIVYFPLTLLGALTARIKSKESFTKNEQKIQKVAKQVPKVQWYKSFWSQMLLSGLLSFSSIFLEFYYVFNSFWGHKIYHLYGVFFFAIVLLVLVVACVSISMTYFTIQNLDYNWWWKSFFYGGSLSFFVLLYSFYFYFSSNMFGFIQLSYYFGITIIIGLVTFITFGSLGFYFSYKFITYIYEQSKIH